MPADHSSSSAGGGGSGSIGACGPISLAPALVCRRTSGAGEGCFATRDIDAGVCILAERPLRAQSFSLLASAVRDNLGHYDALCRPSANEEADAARGIVAQNGFLDVSGEGACLCLRVSKLNHSCSPRCAVVDCADGLVRVVTTRPIRKGEEVCFCYSSSALFQPRAQRRATLQRMWSFSCECERCTGGIHRDEQRAWRLLEEAAAAASESKPRLPPPLDGGTNARVHALQRTALMAMDQELSPLMPERAELIANLHYFGGGGGGPAGSVHEASHEEDVRKKETETSEQTRVAEAAAAPFEIRPLHELLSGLREEAALPSGAWRHPSVSLLPAAEPPPPLSSWPPVLRHASLHAALFTWMPALNLLALALAGCCLWACVRSISADGVAEMGVASEMYDALLSPVWDALAPRPPARPALEPTPGASQCGYELLRAFHFYASSHGVRYTLGAGTLLGAMRNDPPGLLQWEHDVDVYVPGRDAVRLLRQLRRDCDCVGHDREDGEGGEEGEGPRRGTSRGDGRGGCGHGRALFGRRHRQSRWCRTLHFRGLVDSAGRPCCGFGFKLYHRRTDACELDVLVLAASPSSWMHGETWLWPPWGPLLAAPYQWLLLRWRRLGGGIPSRGYDDGAADAGHDHYVIPEDVRRKVLMADDGRWCDAGGKDEWAWCGGPPLSFFHAEFFAPGDLFPFRARRFHGLQLPVPNRPWALLRRTYGKDCEHMARLNEHRGAVADLRTPEHAGLRKPAAVRRLPWWRV